MPDSTEYDLTTEEGRKQGAIANAFTPTVISPTPGQRFHIRYIDSPPIAVRPIDEPIDINQNINTGLLIYEFSGRKWELVEALSYRELQGDRLPL